MATIHDTSWEAILELHQEIDELVAKCATVAEASQVFASKIAAAFQTVALSRVFLVLPAKRLPSELRSIADGFGKVVQKSVSDSTPVLTLAGTAGRETSWNDRSRSRGHRAIPLIDRELVQGAPMIAELVASLNINLDGLSSQTPAEIRALPGRLNARFYVPDAATTVDSDQRHVIASRDFVRDYGIKTVFGMGGRYVSGDLAVAIIFTTEPLDARRIDQFPTFISSFKMRTSSLAASDRWFEPS